MISSVRYSEARAGFTLASVPDFGKMSQLLGNTQVLGMVDHGRYNVSIFKRTWILLNRNYSVSTEGKVFWLHNVVLLEPQFIPGSVKAGVELLRPSWNFRFSGSSTPITQGRCFLAQDFTTTPANHFTPSLCTLWKSGVVGVGSCVVLGPVYTPAEPFIRRPVRTGCTF